MTWLAPLTNCDAAVPSVTAAVCTTGKKAQIQVLEKGP